MWGPQSLPSLHPACSMELHGKRKNVESRVAAGALPSPSSLLKHQGGLSQAEFQKTGGGQAMVQEEMATVDLHESG